MTVLYWLCGIVFTLTAGSAIVFFGLHIATGEHVPRERAVALYRWAVVTGLGTFNLWIFKRVFDGIRVLIH
ncbi:hypothetical protein HLB44_31290 [Aquincola sp. S2]|uniref:Uncharacterized protein n=1 Tax=Pseudaquabacterium terrae TaxID=2732868 RepID=A0ABX2ES71_9BURK|nr:hypothetical protein [Aquabacterium terrae]NRF71481.1 hypothetical protein [Aquabacterium terrae]